MPGPTLSLIFRCADRHAEGHCERDRDEDAG
jgi:hypothetical protein